MKIKAMDPKWWLARMYRQDWGESPTQLEVSGISSTLSAEEFQRMIERLTDEQRETFLGLWNIMTARVPIERPAIEVKAVTE